jgi:hypothetical protein
MNEHPERPTLSQLQRARAIALRDGDVRRANLYAAVVDQRIRVEQERVRQPK